MKECYEQSTSVYGDTIFEKVPTYGDAKIVIEEMGHKVDEMRVEPIIVKKNYDLILNTYTWKSKGYIHVHFFNAQGLEIGYWTKDVNILTIFKTPRVWDKKIFDKTEYPCNFQTV